MCGMWVRDVSTNGNVCFREAQRAATDVIVVYRLRCFCLVASFRSFRRSSFFVRRSSFVVRRSSFVVRRRWRFWCRCRCLCFVVAVFLCFFLRRSLASSSSLAFIAFTPSFVVGSFLYASGSFVCACAYVRTVASLLRLCFPQCVMSWTTDCLASQCVLIPQLEPLLLQY